MIFIRDQAKIERFQGVLDSLSIYFQLTDESQVDYTTETGKSEDLLYCRLVQYTKHRWKIEYYIEYKLDYDVIVLEINFPIHIHKTMFKLIKNSLHYKNSVVEKLKNTVTCKFFYTFENIAMLPSIGLLMIEVSKLKSL